MLQLIKFITLVISLLLTAFAAAAQTTDPSPTPTDYERRLQNEIDRLTLEKTKAELEKDIRNAQPQPTSTPLTGDATGVKDLKMEMNLQTYKSLRNVTDRIACDITTNVQTPKPKVLVLYKSEVYQSLVNYRAMKQPLNGQLDSMVADYDELLKLLTPQPDGVEPDGFIAPIALGLRGLADLLALFRSNVDFTYSSVTVGDNALKSMISNSLRRAKPCQKSEKSFNAVFVNDNLKIYEPDVFYPVGDGQSKLVAKIGELISRKQRASRIILLFDTQTAKSEAAKKAIETEEAAISALKSKLETKNDEKKELESQLRKTKAPAKRKELLSKIRVAADEITKIEGKMAESVSKKVKAEGDLKNSEEELSGLNKFVIILLRQLNTEFTQFYTALTARDAVSQSTPLSQLIKIEALADIFDDSPNESYWLSIKSVDAGGTTRVRKNLFRSFYYPDISINGGSIVEYAVSRPNGEIIISNVNSAVQKFRKPGNIFKENKQDNDMNRVNP